MNAKKAKRLRKEAYGDFSLRAQSHFRLPGSSTVVRDEKRQRYRTLKRSARAMRRALHYARNAPGVSLVWRQKYQPARYKKVKDPFAPRGTRIEKVSASIPRVTVIGGLLRNQAYMRHMEASKKWIHGLESARPTSFPSRVWGFLKQLTKNLEARSRKDGRAPGGKS